MKHLFSTVLTVFLWFTTRRGCTALKTNPARSSLGLAETKRRIPAIRARRCRGCCHCLGQCSGPGEAGHRPPASTRLYSYEHGRRAPPGRRLLGSRLADARPCAKLAAGRPTPSPKPALCRNPRPAANQERNGLLRPEPQPVGTALRGRPNSRQTAA